MWVSTSLVTSLPDLLNKNLIVSVDLSLFFSLSSQICVGEGNAGHEVTEVHIQP